MWATSPPVRRRGQFVNMRMDPGEEFFLGLSVSLKSAPAQLRAADAAVLGLFSVKQPGLLAFKPAPHSLHQPPREEIKTIFSQIAPAS